MVKQGEQKRVQDRVVVTERDQAGSLGKLADAVRGQNTGKLVQKPEQPAEEQTEVTEQLLFAGQGMRRGNLPRRSRYRRFILCSFPF